MTRNELMKHIGSVEQIGGIRDFTYNDGKAKGVRGIEINTGNFRFVVLPDRCMDIAQAQYKGNAISWISQTGITAPAFYEKDGTSWLRGFYGGLVTTCGFRNAGRPTEEFGLHGRLANIPAEKVSVYAAWEGDEYIMKVSGEMRETIVSGENLVLKRTVSAKLFSDEVTIEDTIVNEGFNPTDIVICYHCNFGYPLVREGSKIVNIPEEYADISAPVHNIEESCIPFTFDDDIVTVGIENGEIGAYVTYNQKEIPKFLLWKMLGEGEYVIGLEPRTSEFGGENIRKNNGFISIKPFEEIKTSVKISVKDLKD